MLVMRTLSCEWYRKLPDEAGALQYCHELISVDLNAGEMEILNIQR